MKKIILAIALFAAVSANAQSDGFFTSSYNNYRETTDEWGTMPSMIGHGLMTDQNANAPLGSGALLLAGLGIAYAMRNKNRK